jgi:hypothetical protein
MGMVNTSHVINIVNIRPGGYFGIRLKPGLTSNDAIDFLHHKNTMSQ